MLARLSASRILDTNFTRSQGLSFNAPEGGIREILLQPDGYFFIGGSWSVGAPSPVSRLYPTNWVDSRFQLGYILPTNPNRIHALAFQPDGKIVGVGDGAVFRALTNAIIDVQAGVQMRWTNRTSAIAVQQDGKILAGGRFQKVGGLPRIDIARLNPDFTMDTNFNAVTIDPNSLSVTNPQSWGISAILLQPDQKILIAGEFGSLNGKPASSIARLNPDGLADDSFQAAVTLGGTTNAMVMNMSFDANGKLLVSGAFSEVNG